MAVTNINAKPVKFGIGGRVIIKIASTNYNIQNLRPGSEFEYEAGLTEILHETSAGVLTTPQNGNQKPTPLKIRCFGTANAAATELEQVLLVTDNSTPDGFRKQFDVYCEVYEYPGATTCKTYRFQKCVVADLKITPGTSFDQFDIDFMDYETKPTITNAATPL